MMKNFAYSGDSDTYVMIMERLLKKFEKQEKMLPEPEKYGL